jgi:hypothetical protein
MSTLITGRDDEPVSLRESRGEVVLQSGLCHQMAVRSHRNPVSWSGSESHVEWGKLMEPEQNQAWVQLPNHARIRIY